MILPTYATHKTVDRYTVKTVKWHK